jgi:RNA polymerase sigma-70 factor (ECF subfamily)
VSNLFAEANLRFVMRTLLRLGARQRDAEDLAQEVFLIVHRRAHEFDVSRRVEPWLYGICRNVMRTHWRTQQSRPEIVGDQRDAAEREGENRSKDSALQERVGLLRKAISELPDSLQEVLVYRDLIGMTLKETATELEIPFDTAKDRLSRARGQLRSKLQQTRGETSHV